MDGESTSYRAYAEKNWLHLKGEAFIVWCIKEMIRGGKDEELFMGTKIPHQGNMYQFELPLRRGRADMVAFHVDGTATVVEVKDGANGIAAVLAGIGQVTAYAVQLGMSSGEPLLVRKALAFSATGSLQTDEEIIIACLMARVIPIYLCSGKDARSALMGLVENAEA
jgi:hypothetical protein